MDDDARLSDEFFLSVSVPTKKLESITQTYYTYTTGLGMLLRTQSENEVFAKLKDLQTQFDLTYNEVLDYAQTHGVSGDEISFVQGLIEKVQTYYSLAVRKIIDHTHIKGNHDGQSRKNTL